jgi:hypothetical protein
MILTSMMGLRRASTVIPLIKQGMIVEGEPIQIDLEKCLTPSHHSSFYGLLENYFVRRIRR